MASLREKLLELIKGTPTAYSRITRTPIYQGNIAEGTVGGYNESRILPGYINLPAGEMDPSTIRHESAHSIYDAAGLNLISKLLAARVSPSMREQLTSNPYYANRGINDTVLSDEALGFGVETPSEKPYVDLVASQIKDPNLKQRLLRLQKK